MRKYLQITYMKNIRGKLSPYTCDQRHCPVIRDRLHRHHLEHHANSRKGSKNQEHGVSILKFDEDLIVTPITNPNTEVEPPKFVQTEPFIENKNTNETNTNSKNVDVNDDTTQTNHIPLKISETIEVLTPNINFYKEYIRNEIQDWIRDVPTYRNPTAKTTKDNLTNELLEDIITLYSDVKDPAYNSKLKLAINNCVENLPLLIPGDVYDEDIFKEGLIENLFDRIKTLNNKFLVDNNINADKIQTNKSTDSFDTEITGWLNDIDFDDHIINLDKKSVAATILNRLRSILDTPMNITSHKLKIKGEIVGILNDLPIHLKNKGNKFIYLNRFAEDLAVRLLSLQYKHRRESNQYNFQINNLKSYDVIELRHIDRFSFRNNLNNKLKDCLDMLTIHNGDIKSDIISIIIDNIDLIERGHEGTVKNYISELIYDRYNVIENQSGTVADYIWKSIKNVIDRYIKIKTTINPQLSGIISVYTSEESQSLASSSKRTKKEKIKLTPQETNYTQKIAALVRSWIDTFPEGKEVFEDREYKETAIVDLAGSVMDAMKLYQVTNDIKKEEEHIRFLVYVWILKFDVFKNIDDAEQFVKDFYDKLKKIPIPDLTKTISGSRHIEKRREFTEKSHPQMEYFPEKLDLIEDQISLWMNEQPSEIYTSNDKTMHNKLIHEVATKLQHQLKHKNPTKEVKTTVSKFLSNVMKSKANINELSDSLSERITKLPDENYLVNEKGTQKKFTERLEENFGIDEEEELDDENVNKTLKEIVSKYIEHFYDIENSVARSALELLLRKAILNNDPAIRKNVYNRLTKDEPDSLIDKELIYISLVSDWLKNIPVDNAFNTAGNTHRIKFINSLARELNVLDELRKQNPDWNYNDEFITIVGGYVNLLPLQKNQEQNIPYIINQLQRRIFGSPIQTNNSYDCSILNEHNLSDFIEEYVLTKAPTVADDEVKLEAWMARLMKEIRNMARNDPNALTRSHVYHKLDNVRIPTEENLKMFEFELMYVKEISQWLHNIPLMPIIDENDEQHRIDMVSDLAQKLSERKYKKNKELVNSVIENEIIDYISTWISQLPLNNNREIIKPILIQQLLARVDNIGQKDNTTYKEPIKQDTKKRNSTKKDTVKRDSVKKSLNIRKRTDSKHKQDISKLNPGQMVVNAVENWLNSLRIEGEEKDVKYMKDDFAKRLFKKIGEINTDLKIFNDDDLYQGILNEEIDSQLEAIPLSDKSKDKTNKFKSDLIHAILEARNIMKHKFAGDDYVLRLTNTLDASIPNPIYNKQYYDPGFEIYKNYLAHLFILTNFDYSNDDFKIPYEKKIRETIDKYAMHASNRNAIPLTKDEINNELFSVLFKVPRPNKEAITKEVEEIKTKLIINSWYNELPLEESNYDLTELLELDKLLMTMSKRIHELEIENATSENMLKEIKKWMTKLPFEVKFRCKQEVYANTLLNKLNSTKEERKCSTNGAKSATGKAKKADERNFHVSQIQGPRYITDNAVKTYKMSCCQLPAFTERNPVDLILEITEAWFEKLPLQANEEEQKILKTDAVTNMVLKISELNADPNILYHDNEYFALIYEELDKVLFSLPLRCDFPSTSDYKKSEFMNALRNIKPLIEDEKARHEYKRELKDTVHNLLEPPTETSDEKNSLFNHFKDELVEEFVQYYYNKDDEDGRQFYKNQVHDTVLKYIEEVLNKKENIDPLILRNQLICELEKIPIPNENALKHDVEEIRMKEEVAAFLNENSIIPNNKVQEQIKTSLAKKLFEIERTGHTCDNEKKMKGEIFKSTRKMGKELSPDKVDMFVHRLKETEPLRKAPPTRSTNGTLHSAPNRSQSINQTVHGMPHSIQITTSRRLVPAEPSIVIGNDSRNCHNTNPNMFDIDRLVQEADKRWTKITDESTYGRNQELGVNHDFKDQAYSTIGLRPYEYQNIQGPGLSRSLPLTNKNKETAAKSRVIQSTNVPRHAFSNQSLQGLPYRQSSFQLIQGPVVSTNHSSFKPGNLSCGPCGHPCLHRISPNQKDPCKTISPGYGQNVQNNNISSRLHQSLQNMNQFVNVDIDHSPNYMTGPSQSFTPTGGVINATNGNITGQTQSVGNNIGPSHAPCGTPMQMSKQFAEFDHAGHDSVLEHPVPSCCRNAQSSVQANGGAYTPYPYQHASNNNIQPNVDLNTAAKTCGTFQETPVSHRQTSSHIHPTAGLNIASELPDSAFTYNKNRAYNRPTAYKPHGPSLGQYRRQLQSEVEVNEERPNEDQREYQDPYDEICKCGKRRLNKRRHDKDFKMCFGRLPRCFYY